MPFADGSFDLILCRAAFKNFSEPVEALKEIHRILPLNGKAIIPDLCKDAPRESIDSYIDGLLERSVYEMDIPVHALETSLREENLRNSLPEAGFKAAKSRKRRWDLRSHSPTNQG